MPTKQLLQFSFAANTERQSKVKAQRGRSDVAGTRLQEARQGKEGLAAAAAATSPVTPSITYNPSIPCEPEHPALPVTPLAGLSTSGNKALWSPADLGQDPFDPSQGRFWKNKGSGFLRGLPLLVWCRGRVSWPVRLSKQAGGSRHIRSHTH